MDTVGFISAVAYTYFNRGSKAEDKEFITQLIETMIDWDNKNDETKDTSYLRSVLNKIKTPKAV
jgi:hypothetical protein